MRRVATGVKMDLASRGKNANKGRRQVRSSPIGAGSGLACWQINKREMMDLKPGMKLMSGVCDGQFIVVRSPKDAIALTCGGAPLVQTESERTNGASPASGSATGSLIGKRYTDEALGVELLCTRGGKGSLACNGTALELKSAKPLPASD